MDTRYTPFINLLVLQFENNTVLQFKCAHKENLVNISASSVHESKLISLVHE